MNQRSLPIRNLILVVVAAVVFIAFSGRTLAQTSSASVTHVSGRLLLDLNKASIYDLEQLPGVDGYYARKIIDGRPYRAKADLLSRRILPKAEYSRVAPSVYTQIKSLPQAHCND